LMNGLPPEFQQIQLFYPRDLSSSEMNTVKKEDVLSAESAIK